MTNILSKIFGNRAAKIIACLTTAVTVAFTSGALLACAPNSSGDGTGTGTDSSSGSSGSDTSTSKYSQILQEVLDSDYYNSLTSQYVNNHWIFTNSIAPMPYAFWEKQGVDVQPIKNDKQNCSTFAYVENDNKNELIVNVRVETEGFGDKYYACYRLKYAITDKEYEDLYMLHDGRYIEAPYFIQHLAEVKTPTVLSNINVDVTTLDKLDDLFNSSTSSYHKYFDTKNMDIDFINIEDINNISLEVRSAISVGGNMISSGTMRNLDMYIYEDSVPTITNNVYKIKTIYNYSLTPTNYDDFRNNSTAITYFYSHGLQNINMSIKAK